MRVTQTGLGIVKFRGLFSRHCSPTSSILVPYMYIYVFVLLDLKLAP